MRIKLISAFLFVFVFLTSGSSFADRPTCSLTNRVGNLLSSAKHDSRSWTSADWIAWEQRVRGELGSDPRNEALLGSMRRHYQSLSLRTRSEARESLQNPPRVPSNATTRDTPGFTNGRPAGAEIRERGPSETLVRYGSREEAEATRAATGLQPRPGHERQPKWITMDGQVDPRTLGRSSGYTHRMEFEVEPGTIRWLRNLGTELKPDVEPNRFAVPANRVDQFNNRIRSIEVGPARGN